MIYKNTEIINEFLSCPSHARRRYADYGGEDGFDAAIEGCADVGSSAALIGSMEDCLRGVADDMVMFKVRVVLRLYIFCM